LAKKKFQAKIKHYASHAVSISISISFNYLFLFLLIMKSLELRVYEILKNRFSEKEAEAFIEYFESKTNEKIDDKKDIFLTKQDKIDLIEKMNKDKLDLIKWMFGFWITIVMLLLANWFLK